VSGLQLSPFAKTSRLTCGIRPLEYGQRRSPSLPRTIEFDPKPAELTLRLLISHRTCKPVCSTPGSSNQHTLVAGSRMTTVEQSGDIPRVRVYRLKAFLDGLGE